MLIDASLIHRFSKLCADNNIDSVDTLLKQLTNEEFKATDAGTQLTELLQALITVIPTRHCYTHKENLEA